MLKAMRTFQSFELKIKFQQRFNFASVVVKSFFVLQKLLFSETLDNIFCKSLLLEKMISIWLTKL